MSIIPFRKFFEQLLAKRDYVLKDSYAPLRGYDGFLKLATEAGFSPGTVIDVGVAHGTPWLHDAFPDAHLVLIEPQSQFRESIAAMLSKRKGEWHQVALGEEPGEAVLNIMTSHPSSSSLLAMSDEHAAFYDACGVEHGMHQEMVQIVRLDSIDSSQWPKPWLLKIDVEGLETEVVKGATAVLGNVTMIIAELSLNNAYEGSSFAEKLLVFEQSNFPLYEIIEMQARGRFGRGRVTMMDGVFLPSGQSVLNDNQA
jgi:FkbM family methyltransferase